MTAAVEEALLQAQGRVQACLGIADRARWLIECMAMIDGETVTARQLDELACQARDWLRGNIPSKAIRKAIDAEACS